MKKLLSTLLFSTIITTAYAQTSFEFDSKFQPNSTYVMDLESVMDMNISIETEVEIPEMEKNMTSSTETQIKLQTVTSAEDKQKNIPFEMFYKDIQSKTIINGAAKPMSDEGLKGLYQVKIKGVDNGIKREFGEIEGPEEFKKMFEILYDSFESMLFTPKGTFTINESQSIFNEIKVPMPDGSEFVFGMNSSYTLTKIENGLAFFDIRMTAKPMQKKMEAFTIEVESYDVSGKIKLDINDNNIAESTIQGPMMIKMVGEGFKMSMKTNYDYKINSKKL